MYQLSNNQWFRIRGVSLYKGLNVSADKDMNIYVLPAEITNGEDMKLFLWK